MSLNTNPGSRALRRMLAGWIGSVLVAVAGLVSVLVVPERHLAGQPAQASAAGAISPARQPVSVPSQAVAPAPPASRSTL